MKARLLSCLPCVLLAACATSSPLPPSSPSPFPAPSIVQPAAVVLAVPAQSEIEALLAYHQSLRQLLLPDLLKELANLKLEPVTPRRTLQKAMVLALTHGNGTLAQAQTYADSVVNSTEPEAQPLKPLARLLAIDYAEWRRLSEMVEKLTQQARDSQHRIDQLNGMLEGLKAIERTLPTRLNGGASAAMPPPAKR